MVYFFKCYSYNFIVMVKTFERNLVHIWLKKLGIARRALGSVLFQADRAAGRPAAGFVNRVLGSARQKKPSTRLFLRLVFGCIEADFCVQILILQHFSRSIRFAFLGTAQMSKFQQKLNDKFGHLRKKKKYCKN